MPKPIESLDMLEGIVAKIATGIFGLSGAARIRKTTYSSMRSMAQECCVVSCMRSTTARSCLPFAHRTNMQYPSWQFQNEGIPPRAQFDALVTAMQTVVPAFAKGMECLEG